MDKRDIINDTKLSKLLTPAVRTADANSATLDRQGYGSALLSVMLGASGDTLSGSVYLTVKVQDSDDNSAWAAADAADVVIPENPVTGLAAPDANGIIYTCDDAAEDDLILAVAYKGSKRYARIVLDFTGTHSNGIPCAVFGELRHPQFAPV